MNIKERAIVRGIGYKGREQREAPTRDYIIRVVGSEEFRLSWRYSGQDEEHEVGTFGYFAQAQDAAEAHCGRPIRDGLWEEWDGK